MCNTNTPSVTLQTAVLSQVKEFVNNKQTFSVHDITRNIRNKVRDGELEIPEVEVTGASFRFDISHAKVKSLFNDLWNTGVFDPVFTFDRKFNGTYFEYTPSLVTGNTAPQPVACTANTTSAFTPTVTVQIAPTPTVQSHHSPRMKCPSVVVKSRVFIYLTNCKKRNYQPTLKDVQSAIKRDVSTGWTCDEIRTLIVNDLGYNVILNPDYNSASQVDYV